MIKSENLTDREVVVSRVLNAPRELVWEAWTDPQHIVNWWGPNDFITTVEQMDFRVGGIWLHTMTHIDGTRYPNHSIFKEIKYPSKIVYDHGDGEKIWFETTVTFEETVGGPMSLYVNSLLAKHLAMKWLRSLVPLKVVNNILINLKFILRRAYYD